MQNLRERKNNKGVKICPEVQMSEVEFLEPLDENGEREDSEGVVLDDKEIEQQVIAKEEAH